MKKHKHVYNEDELVAIDDYIIPMLLEIMENKDQLTMVHSSRVQRIVDYFIPELLKNKIIKEDDIPDLWVSAILHDIGKIFVKDTILESKLKLKISEYEHVRYHPVRGYRLVKQLDIPEKILLAIRHHHERWDGKTTGQYPAYPDVIKGKKIPLYARIIGIADAFDAMVSKRYYKKPISIEKALNVIKRSCGKQFDPELGVLFIKRIKEIVKIKGHI